MLIWGFRGGARCRVSSRGRPNVASGILFCHQRNTLLKQPCKSTFLPLVLREVCQEGCRRHH